MHSQHKRTSCDPILCLAVMALILIGIVMVYSSSAVYALEEFDDPYYFLKRQTTWLVLGLGVLLIAANFDYRKLDPLTYPAMIVTFLLLIAVMIPSLSKEVGGARRWVSVGGWAFQPSELAKFTLVLFIAKSLVKRKNKLTDFMYGYLPNLIILG